MRSHDLYDTGIVAHHYKPGCWVHQEIVRVAPARGMATKFQPKSSGPLQVIRTNGPLVQTLNPETESVAWMHHDTLRRSALEISPVPEKFLRISKSVSQERAAAPTESENNDSEESNVIANGSGPGIGSGHAKTASKSHQDSIESEMGIVVPNSSESGHEKIELLSDTNDSYESHVPNSSVPRDVTIESHLDSDESTLNKKIVEKSIDNLSLPGSRVIDTDRNVQLDMLDGINGTVRSHKGIGNSDGDVDPSGSKVKTRFGRVVKSTTKPDFIYGDISDEFQSAVFCSPDRASVDFPLIFFEPNPSGSSHCIPSRLSPSTSFTPSFLSTSIRKDYGSSFVPAHSSSHTATGTGTSLGLGATAPTSTSGDDSNSARVVEAISARRVRSEIDVAGAELAPAEASASATSSSSEAVATPALIESESAVEMSSEVSFSSGVGTSCEDVSDLGGRGVRDGGGSSEPETMPQATLLEPSPEREESVPSEGELGEESGDSFALIEPSSPASDLEATHGTGSGRESAS